MAERIFIEKLFWLLDGGLQTQTSPQKKSQTLHNVSILQTNPVG